jgi:hypothetical protein
MADGRTAVFFVGAHPMHLNGKWRRAGAQDARSSVGKNARSLYRALHGAVNYQVLREAYTRAASFGGEHHGDHAHQGEVPRAALR